MDKRSIIGFVLIFAIVVGWMFWEQSQTKPTKPKAKNETELTSKNKSDSNNVANLNSTSKISSASDSLIANNKFGKFFSKFSEGNERITTIENELFIAKISNKGPSILKWQLKKFKKWDKVPTQLIRDLKGELAISFLTYDGAKIDTRDLYFSSTIDKDSIYLDGTKTFQLEYVIEPEPGKKIIRRFKFSGDKYIFDTDIATQNMEQIIPANRGYNLVWNSGLSYQEENSVNESADAHAMALLNGSLAELNADKDEPVESQETGIIDFAGIKTKYFGVAIIPQPWQSFDGTIDLYGKKKNLKNSGNMEIYSMNFRLPFKEGTDIKSFKVYLGPLDYDIVSQYGINQMVNLGFKYGIRQIAEFFMMPILKFIHKFILNYGIAIIIFSILMKLLLYPLSIQQMRSTQKMQLLTPEMHKIREKYKDDNMKQQQEIMKLYSEYGINPAGGCLPMILQMPILIALWQLLSASIDLRQSQFFWWITDLSVPDSILTFGFSILGISHISGLALAMGVTMFFQQKMTVTDPRQQAMVYVMPVMFTLMFSNFPAGLNLYYFMFNVLSIGHQVWMNKYAANRPTLEDLRKAPKKESWLQKKMSEAQKIAESQGRAVPGAKLNNKNNNKPNKKK
ncbi:MAG TPA: membrane protein insertase YidC [Candidatus Kapabacteria bacterium]|nr:membrane protein insertase YidC [Candidatus Kapabacteria bacterium]